ncbi:MAG TPA: hypothetical protein VFT87_00700 [Candidatus Saccharimonadales bacterium]|nr:hypothetical protein [Candidatus Saccharimonadales bacterium]
MRVIVTPQAGMSVQAVRDSSLFKRWATGQTLDSPVRLVTIYRANIWKGVLYQLLCEAVTENTDRPHLFVLRLPTVKVLACITDGYSRWVPFIEQDRVPTGHTVFGVLEGTQHEGETPEKTAHDEVYEELGLTGPFEIAFTILHSTYAAPSSTNDETSFVLATIRVSERELGPLVASLQGKSTGIAANGEALKVTVVPWHEARGVYQRHPYRDGKTNQILNLVGL